MARTRPARRRSRARWLLRQVNGGRVDARSDVFPPGAILYELPTGKRPTGDTMSALMFLIIKGMRPSPSPIDTAAG